MDMLLLKFDVVPECFIKRGFQIEEEIPSLTFLPNGSKNNEKF